MTIVIAAAILAHAAVAGAQDLRSMPNLYQAVRSGWLQFRIIGGRVALDGSRIGNMQPAGQQPDQLSIQSEDGDTVVSYKWSDDRRQFSLEVSNVTKIHIRYGGKGNDPQVPVEYEQPLQGKAVLRVGPDDKQKVYSAADLWHLFLLYPAETKQHLVPLLQLLRPNWKLAETAAAVEAEVLRKKGGEDVLDRKRCQALVEQLGDDSFAKRQAADRALRSADPAVIFFLQELDFSRLDAEQQYRIRRITEALRERLGEDSPQQAASWLAGDAAVWLSLLGRPDLSVRRQAAKNLSALLGGPIPVDPEADPATQKTRVEQLRQRIEQ